MIGMRIAKSQRWKDQVQDWVRLAKLKKATVIGEATREVFELATSTQPSVKVTGTYTEGFVPMDTGQLIESQQLRVDGNIVAQGLGSAQATPDRVTQRMNVAIEFTAPYAAFVEYGTSLMGGRFFITSAAQQWIPIVEDAVARHIDR